MHELNPEQLNQIISIQNELNPKQFNQITQIKMNLKQNELMLRQQQCTYRQQINHAMSKEAKHSNIM